MAKKASSQKAGKSTQSSAKKTPATKTSKKAVKKMASKRAPTKAPLKAATKASAKPATKASAKPTAKAAARASAKKATHKPIDAPAEKQTRSEESVMATFVSLPRSRTSASAPVDPLKSVARKTAHGHAAVKPDVAAADSSKATSGQQSVVSIPADPEPEHVEPGKPLHQLFMRDNIPSMSVVMVTPELSPVAKVGGLADVVFGLSRELEIRGNSVEILLPKYDCMRYDHIWELTLEMENLWVPWWGGSVHCSVFFGFVHGRKCFFIEPHSNDNFFNRGYFYGGRDDVLRFAFFSRAAMEYLLKSGKHPDIIHCHDWQTGLVPVFLYEIYQHLGMQRSRACYTIHNFRHQGICGHDICDIAGLGRRDYFCHNDRLLDDHNPNALNLMKAGVVYSNFITTVSPRHAGEAKSQGQGFGLEPTLNVHGGKYGGVLNGIDYDTWNPQTDAMLPVPYHADNIEPKYENKRALRQRLLLADNEKPIIAFIGRLDPQKGLDLVRHSLFYAINNGAQFVLLGSSPEQAINDYFWQLKHYLNDNPDCHIEVGFHAELAHLIYAGADMMVVPSRFEPCGLTQLIAMRYGTVPIVRRVGGLADTVVDKDYSERPLHERNGYVFNDDNSAGVESALMRAIACYYQYPEHFRILMEQGMRADFSWNVPGQHYLNIYDHIRAK